MHHAGGIEGLRRRVPADAEVILDECVAYDPTDRNFQAEIEAEPIFDDRERAFISLKRQYREACRPGEDAGQRHQVARALRDCAGSDGDLKYRLGHGEAAEVLRDAQPTAAERHLADWQKLRTGSPAAASKNAAAIVAAAAAEREAGVSGPYTRLAATIGPAWEEIRLSASTYIDPATLSAAVTAGRPAQAEPEEDSYSVMSM